MPRSPEDWPTSVRLTRELRQFLKQEAKKQGCSMGFKIRQIVDERYQQWLKDNDYVRENIVR